MTETLSMDKLEGKPVLTKDGRRLGAIAGVHVNPETWHVDSLTVRLDRNLVAEFGMVRKLFGSYDVGIRTEHVSAVSDTLILNTTLAELEASREAATAPEAQPSP